MIQALDSNVIGYVVVAFVPNMLLMLWVMARMHREIRVVSAKLGIVESDNRVLDEGLKALAHEVSQLREQLAPQNDARPRAVASS
jgi:hypothetical protein